MKREGNTIGAEGRRQGNTDPDRPSDKPDRLERQADAEIDEHQTGAGVSGATGAADRDRVQKDPQGTKPGTARKLEQADPESHES